MLIVRSLEGAVTPDQVMEMDAAWAMDLMAATGAVLEKATKAQESKSSRAQEFNGARVQTIGSMEQLREVLKRQKGL